MNIRKNVFVMKSLLLYFRIFKITARVMQITMFIITYGICESMDPRKGQANQDSQRKQKQFPSFCPPCNTPDTFLLAEACLVSETAVSKSESLSLNFVAQYSLSVESHHFEELRFRSLFLDNSRNTFVHL